MASPNSILITGASSGIGEALAQAYARSGVTLAISGRDAGRLNGVAAACRRSGATVDAKVIDVTDADGMDAWIGGADSLAPIDLVIANAGISGGTGGTGGFGEPADQARHIFDVNLMGVVNTVQPAIARMRQRGKGQIALISSCASFRGIPGVPAYSASKAAVRTYGEALRGSLHRHGIAVSVICPGFVVSRMTDGNRFPMPLIMDADRAAGIIVRGLARNRSRIAFPWRIYALSWLIGVLPPAVTDPLMRKIPAKD